MVDWLSVYLGLYVFSYLCFRLGAKYEGCNWKLDDRIVALTASFVILGPAYVLLLLIEWLFSHAGSWYEYWKPDWNKERFW